MSPAHRQPDPAEAKKHHRPGLQRKVAFNLDWHGVLTSQSQCARSGTLGRRFRWPADIKSKRGERDEADANRCGHDRGCRVRDHPAAAGYADLPGRNVDPGDDAVPAASASAAASAAADDDLPRRVERAGRNDVPDPAAASAATAPRRRTGLSLLRRGRAGPSAFAGSAPLNLRVRRARRAAAGWLRRACRSPPERRRRPPTTGRARKLPKLCPQRAHASQRRSTPPFTGPSARRGHRGPLEHRRPRTRFR